MRSWFKMTTPASVTLTASGGDPRDLISTKCSFLSFWTSFRVISKALLASATDASASAASLRASYSWVDASASSTATIF